MRYNSKAQRLARITMYFTEPKMIFALNYFHFKKGDFHKYICPNNAVKRCATYFKYRFFSWDNLAQNLWNQLLLWFWDLHLTFGLILIIFWISKLLTRRVLLPKPDHFSNLFRKQFQTRIFVVFINK